MDYQALILSLKIASASSLVLAVVGIPLSYWMAQKKSKLLAFVEALTSLPMLLPPTVLGFYLLLVLSPIGLAFSFTGLVIASVLSGIPFAFQSFLTAFRSVDRSFLENSWILGESRFMTFLRVALPLAKEGLLSGIVLSFSHALGEFGVVLMIGGNIPGISRTLSISLYDQVAAFDYEAAKVTSYWLLGMSLTALTLISYLRARRRIV